MNLIKEYRKRPVVIQASEPITKENILKIAEWCMGAVSQSGLSNQPWITISTLEGPHVADLGDRVIRGVHGEFYPIKPAIFDATYEEP
jgi:hypothetical protein